MKQISNSSPEEIAVCNLSGNVPKSYISILRLAGIPFSSRYLLASSRTLGISSGVEAPAAYQRISTFSVLAGAAASVDALSVDAAFVGAALLPPQPVNAILARQSVPATIVRPFLNNFIIISS